MSEKGVCRICRYPRIDEIEAALLVERISMRATADRFGLTRDSVMRHRRAHMPAPTPPTRLVVVSNNPDYPPPQPDPEPEAPPPPKTEEERKSIFIDTVADTGSQQKAMRAAGVNWFKVRAWHEQDEQFTFSFNLAVEHAKDALIDVARDRAIQGTKQVLQIYRRGLLIEERVEYKASDAALLAMLKAYKPELFGDKLAVTQTTVVKAIDAAAWEAI